MQVKDNPSPVLTLHQGDARQTFTEHPIETARKALEAAASVETGELADVLARFARRLPDRGPIANGGN
jgi:hypothetical protein